MRDNGPDYGKLVLRLLFGGMMLVHGIPKLQKLFAGAPFEFPDPLGVGALATLVIAVIAEVVCAILIIVGWKTRWATLPLIVTMMVAAFVQHGGDGFGQMEKALLYLAGYIAIGFLGAGRYSIDRV